MPNWCDCELIVESKKGKGELTKFKNFAKKGDKILCEDKFIPYPKKFLEQDKKAKKIMDEYEKKEKKDRVKSFRSKEKREEWYKNNPYPQTKDGFNSGGYEWCVENWGTKWGICDAQIVEEENYKEWHRIMYAFQCAWSPPEPVIKAMAKKFPKLDFTLRYFECGVGFNGILTLINGEVVKEDCGHYYGDRGG